MSLAGRTSWILCVRAHPTEFQVSSNECGRMQILTYNGMPRMRQDSPSVAPVFTRYGHGTALPAAKRNRHHLLRHTGNRRGKLSPSRRVLSRNLRVHGAHGMERFWRRPEHHADTHAQHHRQKVVASNPESLAQLTQAHFRADSPAALRSGDVPRPVIYDDPKCRRLSDAGVPLYRALGFSHNRNFLQREL